MPYANEENGAKKGLEEWHTVESGFTWDNEHNDIGHQPDTDESCTNGADDPETYFPPLLNLQMS